MECCLYFVIADILVLHSGSISLCSVSFSCFKILTKFKLIRLQVGTQSKRAFIAFLNVSRNSSVGKKAVVALFFLRECSYILAIFVCFEF
jgi:hypothetical protein